MSYYRRVDRTLRHPQWGIRIVTALILIAGLAVLAVTFSRSESRRLRALDRLALGDTSAHVVDVLGPPERACDAGSLEHLRGRFPAGWSPPAVERTIEWLEAETQERWIYPLREVGNARCDAPADGSEIGFGEDMRVLWLVPLIGRRPLQLPAELGPGTLDEESDDA